MQDQPDGLLATFRAESEQTKWLLRFGAAGAVFIVMWSWAGSLLLPTLVVGAVNLLAVLTYGAGIAIFVVRIMYASKPWQIEVRARTNSFQKEQVAGSRRGVCGAGAYLGQGANSVCGG